MVSIVILVLMMRLMNLFEVWDHFAVAVVALILCSLVPNRKRGDRVWWRDEYLYCFFVVRGWPQWVDTRQGVTHPGGVVRSFNSVQGAGVWYQDNSETGWHQAEVPSITNHLVSTNLVYVFLWSAVLSERDLLPIKQPGGCVVVLVCIFREQWALKWSAKHGRL